MSQEPCNSLQGLPMTENEIEIFESYSSHTKIKFDYSKIVNWTNERQKLEPCFSPFVAEYSQNGRQLIYLSAKHGNKTDNANTFSMVENQIKNFRPDIVIIEGVPSFLGESPEEVKKYAKTCSDNEFSRCGESMYTAHLASSNGIPFIGGEPGDNKVFKELTNKGISRLDVEAFFVLRNCTQWIRSGKSFEENFKNYQTRFDRSEGRTPLSIDEFKIWYKVNMNTDFKLEDVTSESIMPLEKGNFGQRMSYAVDEIRERNILEVVNNEVNRNRRVLIVYGSGHHVKHKEVLNVAFAKVQYPCKSQKK